MFLWIVRIMSGTVITTESIVALDMSFNESVTYIKKYFKDKNVNIYIEKDDSKCFKYSIDDKSAFNINGLYQFEFIENKEIKVIRKDS